MLSEAARGEAFMRHGRQRREEHNSGLSRWSSRKLRWCGASGLAGRRAKRRRV